MPARCDLADRIVRTIIDPLWDVASPAVGAQRDDVARTRSAYGIQQRLHAGGLPATRAIGDAASVQPAIPADVMRLVEQIEDHAEVVLEEACHRGPVGGAVIQI